MSSLLFVDSWGWLVLANQREDSFAEVSSFYRNEVRAGTGIVTSDYILDEVITFLFAKAPPALAAKYLKDLLASMAEGTIQMERIGPDRFEKAWKMRLKFQDQPKISFTDFTSFTTMQDLSIRRVLTNDRHFETVNLGFERVCGLLGS